MKSLFFSSFVLLALLVSCSSDDSVVEEPQQIDPNFYALQVGNTWTYEYFERDRETGEFVTLNAFDEVKIIETSDSNGETFYSFETTTTGNNSAPFCVPPNGASVVKLRDSLGFLVNENHQILFSYKDEQEYLAKENIQAPFNLYGILISGTENIEVSAGSFPSLRNEVYAKFEDGTIALGRNLVFYSEGIGQIKETYSTASKTDHYAEKRLISFEVEN